MYINRGDPRLDLKRGCAWLLTSIESRGRPAASAGLRRDSCALRRSPLRRAPLARATRRRARSPRHRARSPRRRAPHPAPALRMARPRHQPGGLCLLLLLLCQFMEDRSAQGKRGGMRREARRRAGVCSFRASPPGLF